MPNAAESSTHTASQPLRVAGDADHRIVIRPAWFTEMRNAGLDTEQSIARALSVTRSTVARAHRGEPVNGRLIAAALMTVGPAKFNLLFKVAS